MWSDPKRISAIPLKRPYFAHAVNSYDTPIERAFVALAADFFEIPLQFDEAAGAGVENPNQPHHQVGYTRYAERQRQADTNHKGMSYFYDEVLPFCDGCVSAPFLDGRMGLGVAGETKWFLERGKPCFLVHPTREPTTEELRRFEEDFRSGLFGVRLFTGEEQALIRTFDMKAIDESILNREKAPWERLVVPHLETRLRTFFVYNQTKRPYETAHLAEMPLPADFYPAKK